MSPVYDPDLAEKRKYNVDIGNEEEWSILYWRDGNPLRFDAIWAGRGLHLEIGTRAYLSLIHI